ncbi:rhodopsin, GQ-coupled-like [Ambystoma mexicanum]|uniref:rhodopsin, GQ-coupled-like n=1 Tax=Ambystoma mexicanum TaxID=8296 RepID=UPI0037E868A2
MEWASQDGFSLAPGSSTPVFRVPEEWESIIGVYLLSLGWLSWLGNGAVIFIMYSHRHSLDPHDYLTFNLAVADAGISIFGYSRGILQIFNLFRDDGFLITSLWTCKVDGFLILLFGLISINTLTVISVIRYIKGCQPHQAHRVDRRSIAVALLGIWAGALFWAGAPLLGWGSYTDRKYGTCEIDWIMATVSATYKLYVIGVLLTGFLIPVCVMVFCYVSIIRTVRFSHKCTRGLEISQRQQKMERDITRVSLAICVAFLLAWTPYAVISLWSACGVQVPPLTSVLASLFAKSATFYNPFIYIGMSSKFRKDISGLFRCTRQDRDLRTDKRRPVREPKKKQAPPSPPQKYTDATAIEGTLTELALIPNSNTGATSNGSNPTTVPKTLGGNPLALENPMVLPTVDSSKTLGNHSIVHNPLGVNEGEINKMLNVGSLPIVCRDVGVNTLPLADSVVVPEECEGGNVFVGGRTMDLWALGKGALPLVNTTVVSAAEFSNTLDVDSHTVVCSPLGGNTLKLADGTLVRAECRNNSFVVGTLSMIYQSLEGNTLDLADPTMLPVECVCNTFVGDGLSVMGVNSLPREDPTVCPVECEYDILGVGKLTMIQTPLEYSPLCPVECEDITLTAGRLTKAPKPLGANKLPLETQLSRRSVTTRL